MQPKYFCLTGFTRRMALNGKHWTYCLTSSMAAGLPEDLAFIAVNEDMGREKP